MAPNLTSVPNLGQNKLRFGLQLDGIAYSDLGPVQVIRDPTFEDLGSYDFQYPFETTVAIAVSSLVVLCILSYVRLKSVGDGEPLSGWPFGPEGH